MERAQAFACAHVQRAISFGSAAPERYSLAGATMYRVLFSTLALSFGPLANAQSAKAPRVAIVVLSDSATSAPERLALALDSAVHATGVPAPAILVRPDTMSRRPMWYAFGYGQDDSLSVADRRAFARFVRIDALIEIRVRDPLGSGARIAVWCVRTSTRRQVLQEAIVSSQRDMVQQLAPQVLQVLADLGREFATPRSASASC
jgi:hypothetical protein